MGMLDGKVVVITGASSGIGRALAVRSAEEGARVVLVARNDKELKKVADECASAGAEAECFPIDVTSGSDLQRLTKKVWKSHGHIDVWVNNAAVTMFAKFEDAPPEAYRRVIETNLYGYMNGARAVLPYFREQGSGIMINVSSMIGRIGTPFVSAYSTSKHAINGWAESLRMELTDAPGIHVCTLMPGSVDTPLFQHAANFTGRAIKPMPPVYKPDSVVEAAIQCMVKPKREIYVGGVGAVVSAVRTIVPGLAERMMARQVDKSHFKDEEDEDKEGLLFKHGSGPYSVEGGWGGKNAGSGKTVVAAVILLAAVGAGTAIVLSGRGKRPINLARRTWRKAERAWDRLTRRAPQTARGLNKRREVKSQRG